jgi:hypothetical protein
MKTNGSILESLREKRKQDAISEFNPHKNPESQIRAMIKSGAVVIKGGKCCWKKTGKPLLKLTGTCFCEEDIKESV